MPQSVAEVMTRDPSTVNETALVTDAARVMRDRDIGDVIVMRGDGSVCGIVTDRDLALRVVAEGLDPDSVKVEDICDHRVISIGSSEPAIKAIKLMRDSAIRRLPVIDGDELVGILTLGDLAIDRDPDSALADISEAPPNN